MAGFEIPKAELVDLDSLADLEKQNAAFLEAQYRGQVADFRADVIQRMLAHNALHGRIGWLVYSEQPQQESSVLVDAPYKETLILLIAADNERRNAPHIRVITKTPFQLDDQVAILTEDVTVDSDGDAYMHVDAMFVDISGNVLSSPNSDVTTLSPYFYVHDNGQLTLHNFKHYTPSYEIDTVVEREVEGESTLTYFSTIPFGRYIYKEDRIAALEWAKSILTATEQAELTAIYTETGE